MAEIQHCSGIAEFVKLLASSVNAEIMLKNITV